MVKLRVFRPSDDTMVTLGTEEQIVGSVLPVKFPMIGEGVWLWEPSNVLNLIKFLVSVVAGAT